MKLFSRRNIVTSKGFTLLEILVVVAISSIIISLGVPTFQSFIQDKRHLQGETMLLALLQQQQNYFSDNDTYTATLEDINYDAKNAKKENKIYFTIEAKPCGTQLISQCVQLIASPIVNGDSYFSVSSVSDTLVESSTKP